MHKLAGAFIRHDIQIIDTRKYLVKLKYITQTKRTFGKCL